MSAYPIKFGKYLLLERVNVGGMAEVFKAKTFGVAGFERILAIKRILPSLVEDDDFVKMFIDEARIAVQLNHANIVQIYELGKHGEHYYIAMEYLPSRDLRSILDKMRANGQLMSIPQSAYTISKVCEGLDYAHRRRDPSGQPMNIVHRDVSPQNVLVSFEGEIKIIDFGIAKAANRASKTQAGVLKGKFGYMSPEQVRGLPIDRRSDIFAVGVLLYEMLTGERLFVGESDFSTLERVRNAEVAPPSLYNKKISPELEAIVLKSLAREVEDRYQWASEFAEDLQRFLIEDRSIYSAKRLAAYMKESYAEEIAHERRKMEEFLSVGGEKAEGTESEASPPSPRGKTPPPTAARGILSASASDEAEPVEGEDKTFVIEASAAMASLVDKGARPPAKPPLVPENTNDDYLQGASLYGEDDMSEPDDAHTLVSFQNPFDEQGEPNTASAARDDLAASDEESARTKAARGNARERRSSSGPIARTRDELSSPSAVSASTAAVEDATSGVVNPGAPTLLMPAVDPVVDRPVDVAAPPPPVLSKRAVESGVVAEDVAEASEAAVTLSKTAKRAIFAALAASVFVVVALVALLVAIPDRDGSDGAIAQAVLTANGETPPSVQVFVDGAESALALPAALALSPDDAHVVRVTAEGYEPFEVSLPPLGAGVTQPIAVTLRRAEGAVVAVATSDAKPSDAKPSDAKPSDAKPSDTKPTDAKPSDAKPGDAKPSDAKPSDAKPGDAKPSDATPSDAKPGDAKPSDAKPSDAKPSDVQPGDEKPGEALATTASASGDPWLLAFATIDRGARRPVHGAEVHRDGVLVGTTPIEIELPRDVSKVVLRIKAEGFVAKDVEFARGDAAALGPATVALTSVTQVEDGAPESGDRVADAKNGEPTDQGASGAGPSSASPSTKPDDDGTKVAANGAPNEGARASSKGEPAAAEPSKGNASSAQPTKGEPSSGEPSKAAKSDKVASRADKHDDKRADDKRADDKRADDKRADDKRADDKRDRDSKKGSEKKPATSNDTKSSAKTTVLAIGTRPPAEVYIDKKLHGMAPLMGPKAPEVTLGKHFVTLKEPKSGKKVTLEVNVQKADGKAKIIYRFDDDAVDATGVSVKKK